MNLSFTYEMGLFLIKFFSILLFYTKINGGLFARNNKEILVDFSLSQLLAESESNDGSLRSLDSLLSLESFRSCFSEFQSQSSYYSAFGNDPTDSTGQTPCEFECLCSKEEILQLIRKKNFKKLKKVQTFLIEQVMEELIQQIKSILSKYESQMSSKLSLLAQYKMHKQKYRKEIKKLKKEIKLLKLKTKCYLSRMDFYLFNLFKHLFSIKIKRFKLTTKDLKSSQNISRVSFLQRKIAFSHELLSFLQTAFSYYLCGNEFLAELHLCVFIVKQHIKITKLNEETIKLHKKAIENIRAPASPDLGFESKLETIPEEFFDLNE
ncbi:Uncharacterized protein cmbei_3001150 [Cryptosporidium meleagridis]